ncbi:MAG: RidA family protein [Conexibacteraceae bacterium]|nr:RidA family protein [Conexibacteraceae bacterium]
MCADSTQIKRLGGDPPSPYEDPIGFSRVVSAGPWVLIGGTTAVDPSGFVVGTTPYEQTLEVLRKLLHELSRVGFGAEDVVMTRMYVTDISRSEEVGRAHGEVFGSVRPVATMVEVSGLIDPRMLVEIELTAYRG